MKSSTPSSCGSTRELRCASGGCAACATAWASRTPPPPLRRLGTLPALWGDDREAMGRLLRPSLERLDQGPGADGLVRHHQDVLHRLGPKIDDDVLDRQLRPALDPLDEIPAQPPRARVGMRGD